jgi:hypothetical protein
MAGTWVIMNAGRGTHVKQHSVASPVEDKNSLWAVGAISSHGKQDSAQQQVVSLSGALKGTYSPTLQLRGTSYCVRKEPARGRLGSRLVPRAVGRRVNGLWNSLSKRWC